MATPERILLLGEGSSTYGEVTLQASSDRRLACALTVGADQSSPSKQFKAHPEAFPNEDGLCASSEGERFLIAVADAHFGHQSSHAILRDLHSRGTPIPGSPDALGKLVESCATQDAVDDHDSETTLLVAVFDRAAQSGFGISYGDSTLALVDGESVRIVTEKNHDFVTPLNPSGFHAERRQTFRFDVRPGQLLCAYTDGIDECHYRHPETSVRPRHMSAICAQASADPVTFAEKLVELALAGVEGNPGGQDNIALVVLGT